MNWVRTACYNASTNRYNSTLSGSIAYDGNGNLTNDTFHTYGWDSYGNMVSSDGNSYTYDANGQMVDSPWDRYVYDTDSRMLFGSSSQGAAYFAPIRLPGGGRAVYNSGSLSQYQHSDWLGSVRLGSTPSRTVSDDLAFAPFGEVYASSYIGNTFAGMDQVIAADQYETLARKYNTTQGRWISPDPLGLGAVDPTDPQTWNRYVYVRNNPMAMIDPLGEDGCYGPDGAQITATIQATCGDYGGQWLGGGQWVGSDGNVYGPQYFPGQFISAGDPGSSSYCTENCMGTYTPGHWETVNFGSFSSLYGPMFQPIMIGADHTIPTIAAGGSSGPNTFSNIPPIAGSVWIQLIPGVGITIPFAYIPRTNQKCVGIGGGAGGPTPGAIMGPVWGKGDPAAVLSGWSVSVSGAYGLGGQLIHNSSGYLSGPAYGSKGATVNVSWSKCW